MNRRLRGVLGHAIAGLAILMLLVATNSTPAAAQDPAIVGQWSSPMSWPVEAIHLNVLPNGKVMFWGPYPQTISYIWDPVANTVTAAAATWYPPFCAGHVLMADGTLIVLGGLVEPGLSGSADARTYNYQTNTWTALPDMNDGRYYPTATALPNGNVLVISGNGATSLNILPQIWQPGSGTWQNLTTAELALPLYPKMLVAPNGQVFYAGPQPVTRYLNTSGTGSWSVVGQTVNKIVRDYSPAVMYDTGKVIIMGGMRPPSATAEIIDLNASKPAWTSTASMNYARRQDNATILADGTVLVTGGSDGNNTLFDDYNNPVFQAELWNPATGTWTLMASMAQYRGYHSTAALLPDGRVISSGGDYSCVSSTTVFPFKGHCTALQMTAEVYSPPYLFQGPRPTITSAPASITYGQTFFVQTPDAASISKVTWIRLSTVTHTFNENQRNSTLSFTQASQGGNMGLNITAPANSNIAPPGHYMLFILNNGVPSVAAIVQIQ
jgi:galactose oxidase